MLCLSFNEVKNTCGAALCLRVHDNTYTLAMALFFRRLGIVARSSVLLFPISEKLQRGQSWLWRESPGFSTDHSRPSGERLHKKTTAPLVSTQRTASLKQLSLTPHHLAASCRHTLNQSVFIICSFTLSCLQFRICIIVCPIATVTFLYSIHV